MTVKIVQDVVNFLASWNWALLLAYVCSAPFISGLSQIIKRNAKLQKWGVIQGLVGVLATVHAGILLWLTNPALLVMLPICGPALYAYTQPWYPLIKKLDNWLTQFLADLKAKNNQASAAMTNAINNPVPMESLPGQETEQSNETPVW